MRARAKFLVLLCVLIASQLARAQQMVVSADKPDGVYDVGDTVRWTFEWQGDSDAPAARYVLKRDGLTEVGKGDLRFDGKRATLDTKFDEPGAMLVEVQWGKGGGFDYSGGHAGQFATGGAVAAPEKIAPAAPAPADFDAFWQSKLAELAAVPPNPKLERADAGKPGVDYQKVTLDNIRGTRVNGQLARPDKADKFPALLILQYAGVYPLQKSWVTDRAAEGWLALNILAHDLPIDRPDAFYQEQFKGPLKNYWAIGNDDRDASYYLRMYLSCHRAVEYLKSRPDWDGKTLVVMGTSQGGQQAIVTGGLHPDGVTAVLAFLPAACDLMGPEIGRAAGFPNWYVQTHGKDPAKVRETSRYYDPVHFAARIKCPVLVGVALHDDLAPPASVFAAANQVTSPKEIVVLPKAGHQDENGSQSAYNKRCYEVWLPALRKGELAPVAQAPRPPSPDVRPELP